MHPDGARILREVNRVIKGKEEACTKVLMALLAGGNVLLEDVPGVGKTTMAMAFARALGLSSKRIQFTPDTMPSDIIGFSVYDKERGALVYKPGAVATNLLLADEINRTSSRTQAALLEVMAEKKVTVDGITHKLPEPFFVFATENPLGSAGTQMLPHSQLDRFMIRLSLGYPSLESQIELMSERAGRDPLDEVEPVLSREELLAISKAVHNLYIDRRVYDYIARLVEATRQNALLTLGVSPRGALALCEMARAAAFLAERDYVTPGDVRSVFNDVCGHRVVLSPKARLNERSAAEILDSVKQQVARPETMPADPAR